MRCPTSFSPLVTLACVLVVLICTTLVSLSSGQELFAQWYDRCASCSPSYHNCTITNSPPCTALQQCLQTGVAIVCSNSTQEQLVLSANGGWLNISGDNYVDNGEVTCKTPGGPIAIPQDVMQEFRYGVWVQNSCQEIVAAAVTMCDLLADACAADNLRDE
eukprot:TRINITY_DN7085_c0_g1_i2.p1 TRINITY_DN7085_c0_g1~~TRINITY_DN7085_c0_g1_i2.p1  ORF type:complete len:161 (+),score=28.35 TRINITY_DN7085_c0_g1_i2:67-549(+)